MRLLFSAGEASGETYGAQLIEALRARVPSLEAYGVGGPRMAAAAFEPIVHASDISVVGLVEVVTHLPRIYREFHKLLRAADERKPDAAVLIDFPDFNFRLARELYRRGVPVFYYISPQLWAWRPGRIELVRRYVRKMLVIFPFEADWYRERGVEVEYVGHPLAGVPRPSVTRDNFAAEHGLTEKKPWIALLPGSRRKEVLLNLPEMLEAVRRQGPAYEYVLPVASTLDRRWIEVQVAGSGVKLAGDARAALLHARAAVVASGTATVEAALMGTPFVMVYRVAPLTWTLGRPLVKVTRYAMVNLIAGRDVVPELVQSSFTGESIVRELQRIIPESEARARMVVGLDEVRARLAGSGSAAARASEIILKCLGISASAG